MKSMLKTVALVSAIALMPTIANAAGADVQSKLETILDILKACGIVVVTGTVIWGGFKIGWQGESLRNIQGPLIGGVIVGCASYFAGILLG